ncbi:MAG: hypothetical protein EOO50_08470 [Flavobacterium sp.]|uniref:hypothetical protein n=1 Tax=Flavobacterium sp. TaxID=239 RepID=UPI00120FA23F|nr:hypothetical protein [Flavobacterium sp.]RZJ66718.1 MAG: hypothetical protein EOO50_08470 [Flavobacterium sp.]
MGYLKIVPYIYLAAGLFFIYTGVLRYLDHEEGFWIWFVIAALSIFMFFFRMKFARKFEDNRRDKK